jgi:hypothetical protein
MEGDAVYFSVLKHIPSDTFIFVVWRCELATWVCRIEVVAIMLIIPAENRYSPWLLRTIDIAGNAFTFVTTRSKRPTEVKAIEMISRHDWCS